jgi:Thioesterase superfamily
MSTPYTLTITATPADIDELGHVNNAVWVRWIQDVSTAHWLSLATPEQNEAYIWIVTRHEIDYRGNIALGESVTARTWLSEMPRGALGSTEPSSGTMYADGKRRCLSARQSPGSSARLARCRAGAPVQNLSHSASFH